MQLSLVIPCYNEVSVLGETARRIKQVLGDLTARGTIHAASCVYFVDDGSTDGTWSLIQSLAEQDRHFRGIKLSRNCGHQNALLAGLMTAAGDVVISLDADLQDDLGAIEKMLAAHVRGAEIVFGVRDVRASDNWFKRSTAQLYYRLLERLGVDVVYNHADYRLMSRRALDELSRFTEINIFLRGMVPLLGFKTDTVRYDRHERFAGASKYPLRRMLSLAANGITSFSIVPLRFITLLGLGLAGVSFAAGIWALVARLFYESALPGWASTVLPIYFIGGIQLMSIGVVGEYVGRIYLESKRRPRYIIEKTL